MVKKGKEEVLKSFYQRIYHKDYFESEFNNILDRVHREIKMQEELLAAQAKKRRIRRKCKELSRKISIDKSLADRLERKISVIAKKKSSDHINQE